MRRLIFTLIAGATLMMTGITSVKAQDYKNAIGGRFGSANGVTFKTGLNKNAMLELIGNFRSNNGFKYAKLQVYMKFITQLAVLKV